MVIALISAGGTSQRIKQDIPKQFIHIENKPLVIYTLEAFQKHPSIDSILVVCLDGWHEILSAYSKQFNITKLKYIISGGKTGHDSIYNGLRELNKHYKNDDTVIIHDGNRPMISQEILSEGLSTYKKHGSAVAAIPCTEVVFKCLNNNIPNEEIPRETIMRTQTPHIFNLGKLTWAYNKASENNTKYPAACSLLYSLGEKINFFTGSEKNIKITTIDDIDIFKALLNTQDNNYLKR